MTRRGAALAVVAAAAPPVGYLAFKAVRRGLRLWSSSLTYQVCGELVGRVETDERVVALTFDDGPTPADADAILESLERHDVPATFFLCGRDIDAHPELARRIWQSGHQIGNHSYNHVQLHYKRYARIKDEVVRTNASIAAVGYPARIDVRAPYGRRLVALPLILRSLRQRHIMWDVCPEQWVGAEPVVQAPEELADLAAEQVRPGSIVLLHPWDGREASRRAVDLLVPRLKAEGYRFARVDELIAIGAQSAG